MIVQLTGQLIEKNETSIVLDCNGVGYEVFVPTNILNMTPNINQPFTLFTHHHIREDQEFLFGFTSVEQKKLFTLLTSVSGVGPKVGIKILSSYSSNELIAAVLENNLPLLTSISGVGKKMAERLIIDCKDKLSKLLESSPSIKAVQASFTHTHTLSDDVLMALKNLGFSKDEIKKALAKNTTISKDDSENVLIKKILKSLS